MEHSDFGKRFAGKIGIGELMDDLGNALVADPPLMLGGRKPQPRPSPVQARFLQAHGSHSCPTGRIRAGDRKLRRSARSQAVHRVFGRTFPLGIRLEGRTRELRPDQRKPEQFLLSVQPLCRPVRRNPGASKSSPLAPEYIGYSEVGLEKDFFQANRPEITRLDNNLFKYQVDFDSLKINEQTGAVCFSRPTNPTGTLVTDEEVERLCQGKRQGVPLIIDNAYGTPFPNIIYEDAQPVWDEDDRMHEPVQARPARLAHRDRRRDHPDRIQDDFRVQPRPRGHGTGPRSRPRQEWGNNAISREVVRPFYEAKAKRAVAQLQRELEGLPFAIHKPEGALFLWLWFEGLPISTRELYERLKKKGVLVVSGHYFFPGLEENCLTRTNASG